MTTEYPTLNTIYPTLNPQLPFIAYPGKEGAIWHSKHQLMLIKSLKKDTYGSRRELLKPERVYYEFNIRERHRTHLSRFLISKIQFPPTNTPSKLTTFIVITYLNKM